MLLLFIKKSTNYSIKKYKKRQPVKAAFYLIIFYLFTIISAI